MEASGTSSVFNTVQSAQALPSVSGKGKMSSDKIHATAEKFESMFLSQMLSFMQPEIDTDGPFMGGKGEEAFKSFMTNEYAGLMAKTGKTGIADMVERELVRMQSEQPIQS